MKTAGLNEAQAEIKIAGRNINNLRYADDTTLKAEIEKELKSLLMRVKENEQALKAQHLKNEDPGIWFHHFIATRWGKKVEMVIDFIFLGSKITVDGDFSHEIKRQLLPGRKAMTKLDSILKRRDITLPTKVSTAKLWFFQ